MALTFDPKRSNPLPSKMQKKIILPGTNMSKTEHNQSQTPPTSPETPPLSFSSEGENKTGDFSFSGRTEEQVVDWQPHRGPTYTAHATQYIRAAGSLLATKHSLIYMIIGGCGARRGSEGGPQNNARQWREGRASGDVICSAK